MASKFPGASASRDPTTKRFGPGAGGGIAAERAARASAGGEGEEGEEEEEEEEDDELAHSSDRIRRSYHVHEQTRCASDLPTGGPGQQGDTIQVTLNEAYFAAERRALVNLIANARQKINSLQLFNPAQNEISRQKQEHWADKEKYTLDSLNELKGINEKFQWTQPGDGREVWPSKLQYFLAITSYSIGLGNVIRFPILVQKNGGLAFLIPFVIMLLLEGIPLFYLELAIGQRMRKASISCWNLISPFAAGIGLASAAVSFIIGLYYNTMVAWTLMYSWSSIWTRLNEEPLPFTVCPSSTGAPSGPSRPSLDRNFSSSLLNAADECLAAGPYKYHWFRRTLNISPDVEHFNSFNWPLALSLTLAWLISYICLIKGLSSSKRVVYVSSTMPYVILVILFFKALSLNGMSDGVYYFIAPNWPKMFDPFVWLQAAAQVFFSLGLGFGGLIALSSYNAVNNNCYRDAIKVSIINFATSIFAGLVLFAILGFRANLQFQRCQAEREQQINFYISDYNLKALAYQDVFFTRGRAPGEEGHERLADGQPTQLLAKSTSSSKTKSSPDEFVKQETERVAQEGLAAGEDYSLEDALISIKNLDYQLDESYSNGGKDKAAAAQLEGDSDIEFILNTSTLISRDDLDKIIGNIENLTECSLERELDESTQGMGFVFVVLTEAISQFDLGPSNAIHQDRHQSALAASSWAIIFFLMILALGFDSQFGNMEGLISSLLDLNIFTNLNRKWLTGIICTLSLAISLVAFSHGAGSYIFAIFEEFASNFSLVLIALFELLAISYIYGLKRFHDDCELMTGKRPNFVILLSWRYVSPILLLVIILATVKQFSIELNYEAWLGDHEELRAWPGWCVSLGALLIICCTIWIPLAVLLGIFKVSLLPKEEQNRGSFPVDELREYHGLQEEEGTRRFTRLERVLFGFNHDDYY